jgi:heterodisulfide reductase subunit B
MDMKVHYYPGCTLKEKATNLDDSTHAAMNVLGYELVEPENWTCCGAEFPLTEEKIAGLAAPTRILRQVEMEGGEKVVTTCAFCFNVLKRTNEALLRDPLKFKRMNAYLKDDIKIDPLTKEKTTNFPDYSGHVHVLHLMELLRIEFGFNNLKSHIKRDISSLKVAPYYGCRLLRPADEVGIDEPDDPHIFEDFLEGLGCEVVDYPFKQECCGSYLSVSLPDAATEASYQVLRHARLNGADCLVLSCPLCYYNLDRRQDRIKEKYLEFTGFPVLFFTQLLAWALGVDEKVLGLDQHYYDPRPVLGIEDKIEVVS